MKKNHYYYPLSSSIDLWQYKHLDESVKQSSLNGSETGNTIQLLIDQLGGCEEKACPITFLLVWVIGWTVPVEVSEGQTVVVKQKHLGIGPAKHTTNGSRNP